MAFIYRKEAEKNGQAVAMTAGMDEKLCPLWKTAVYFLTQVLILIFV